MKAKVNYTTDATEWIDRVINNYAVVEDNVMCSISITEFGDMSSSMNKTNTGSQRILSSGYFDSKIDIAEEFLCLGYKNETAVILNTTAELTDDLDSLIGKGVVLRLAGTDHILAFSPFKIVKGVPSMSITLTDAIAVCGND